MKLTSEDGKVVFSQNLLMPIQLKRKTIHRRVGSDAQIWNH